MSWVLIFGDGVQPYFPRARCILFPKVFNSVLIGLGLNYNGDGSAVFFMSSVFNFSPMVFNSVLIALGLTFHGGGVQPHFS